MSSLKTKILEKAQTEANDILADAKAQAKQSYDEITKEAKSSLDLAYDRAFKQNESEKNRAVINFSRQTKDEFALIKEQIINSIFNNVKDHFYKLADKALFNYVKDVLKKETLKGDEVIRVSKNDYSKYLKILSTKTGKVVDCDLLNDSLGKNYKLKLSSEPANIDNGFLVVGDVYDLNFSYDELINRLKEKYEKEIFEELN